MHDKIQRYSLRKLSVGLASVMVGACIFSVNGKTVKADVTSDQTTQTTNVQGQTGTAQPQENKNLLDDLGKQKASTQSTDQVEAKNQENRLVDQINYKLTNNSSTDNNQDLAQNNVAPEATKSNSNTKNAEKSTVGSSSVQETNNQSNDHAEKVSQTQPQKLDLTKSSQRLNQKELATNLTQDNSTQKNADWGTDPTKYGFHKTNAGWTKLQEGKDYTSVAKKAHTILLDSSGKELSKNNTIGVNWNPFIGTEIDATIDKNDIKKGNRILISSTAQLYKDGRHFTTDVDWRSIDSTNITSNGTRIGHIEVGNNDTYATNINSSQIYYELVVDQTLDLAKDLNLHLNFPNKIGINEYNAQWLSLKGTTPTNPAFVKLVTNDSDTYNYELYVHSSDKMKPYHVTGTNGLDIALGQSLSGGNVWIGDTRLNPETPFTEQNYTFNKVFKFSRPKSVAGVTIPNFKSKDFNLNLDIQTFYPILTKDGMLTDLKLNSMNMSSTKLADNLSVQQVMESAKQHHFVYSISDDGQSMLVGFNFSTNRDSLGKLTNNNFSINQINSSEKVSIKNTRLATIDYPEQINDILEYSNNWVKSHNGEPYRMAFNLNGWPFDINQPNIQTVSDVTVGVTNPKSTTVSLLPSGIDVDTSIYKQLNVKFVDDDNNEKVINTDTFTTSTGTNLTYNIKSSSDKTFNNTTDIAFPSNYVLNQANSVHYGVIQGTNPDIVIHVRHLVKIISGDADLDLYPEIKKALNGDARRTITITYPAGKQGNNPSTIVQSVHYIRSGKADFTNDTVDESSLTKWNPVASSAHGVTITNGETTFDAVKLPHINGYKAYLIRDKANPAMFMISFIAMPEQSQNDQSTSNEPQQPSDNVQSSQKEAQTKQKQPEPMQNQPAEKQEQQEIAQILNHISYALMHDSSNDADSFEPAQNDSAPLEAPSDSTQKDDAAKPQKVNAAKHKKHIVKKHVVRRHKKHAKKYHLKRRSRKHTKRAKKRIIKHRKSVSRKFRKHNLKHIKKA